MNLIDMARQAGLNPKWKATTQGGEYGSACPKCVGTDRFIMQPHKPMKKCTGYYFCRKCDIHGDTIQFGIDFLNLSYKDALAYTNAYEYQSPPHHSSQSNNKVINNSTILQTPNNSWIQQAQDLLQKTHKNILQHSDIISSLEQRGLPKQAIINYQLGFLPKERTYKGTEWGLEKEKIWLPSGIIIPTIDNQQIIRLKIRQKNWSQTSDLPKYVAIPGSMAGLNIIGSKKNPVMIIVESELDAYALHHAIGDFSFIVAVGGSIKSIDSVTDTFAKNKTTLLICHDNDEAGKNMLTKWQQLYPHAKGYPTPRGKDIGEAIQQGLAIREWIINALPEKTQYALNLKWSPQAQLLIDWGIAYTEKHQHSSRSDAKLLQEILQGPNSPRARSEELLKEIKLMKQLLEDLDVKKNKPIEPKTS